MNKVETNQKKRISNVETLRIVGMLAIITFHGFLGRFPHFDIPVDASQYIFNFLADNYGTLGTFGDCIFFMIAGYFAVSTRKDFRFTRDFRVVGIVLQYSIGFLLLNFLLGAFGISLYPNALVQYTTPFSIFEYFFVGGGLWFVYGYIIISVLLRPLLIKFHDLSVCNNLIIVATLYIIGQIVSYIYSASIFWIPFPLMATIGSLWTFYLGVTLNKLKNNIKFQNFCKEKHLSLVLICCGVILKLLYDLLIVQVFVIPEIRSYCAALLAVGAFIFAINSKPFYNKWVNFFAKGTFGIYIIFGILGPSTLVFGAENSIFANLLSTDNIWTYLIGFFVVLAFLLCTSTFDVWRGRGVKLIAIKVKQINK